MRIFLEIKNIISKFAIGYNNLSQGWNPDIPNWQLSPWGTHKNLRMETLDAIDLKLLKLLQANSRLTTKELSQEVGLSISPVYERVKRLENDGYIERYVALLNPEKLNLGFIAYVSIKLSKQSNIGANEFVNLVQKIPEVTECYSVAGRSDFLMKVYAPNMRYYRTFVLDVLGGIGSIGHIESTFVMSEVKHTTTLPLRQVGDGI